MMQTAIYIWPYMYNSLYGRFLLLQLGGTGNVLILNILISLYSVVGTLASRSTLGLLLKLLCVPPDHSAPRPGRSWSTNICSLEQDMQFWLHYCTLCSPAGSQYVGWRQSMCVGFGAACLWQRYCCR